MIISPKKKLIGLNYAIKQLTQKKILRIILTKLLCAQWVCG